MEPPIQTKPCTLCLLVLPLTEYYLRETGKYLPKCKTCTKKNRKAYYYKNIDRIKKESQADNPMYNYRRWKRLGIIDVDTITYEDLFEKQSGKCAICFTTTLKRLHRDHDHKTGKTRGLLCHQCNSTLGLARDNIQILEKMILYLKQ